MRFCLTLLHMLLLERDQKNGIMSFTVMENRTCEFECDFNLISSQKCDEFEYDVWDVSQVQTTRNQRGKKN